MEKYKFKIKEAPAYIKNESLGQFIGGIKESTSGCIISLIVITLCLGFLLFYSSSGSFYKDMLYKSVMVIVLIIMYRIFYDYIRKVTMFYYYENGIVTDDRFGHVLTFLYADTPLRFVHEVTITTQAFFYDRRSCEVEVYALFNDNKYNVLALNDELLFEYVFKQYCKYRIPQIVREYKTHNKFVFTSNDSLLEVGKIEVCKDFIKIDDLIIEAPIHYFIENGKLIIYNSNSEGDFTKKNQYKLTIDIHKIYDAEGLLYIMKNEMKLLNVDMELLHKIQKKWNRS